MGKKCLNVVNKRLIPLCAIDTSLKKGFRTELGETIPQHDQD
jgi:hypothetical protein